MRLYRRGKVFWVSVSVMGTMRRFSTRKRTLGEAKLAVREAVRDQEVRLRRHLSRRSHAIYFIEAVGADRVKIGRTVRSPSERLKGLRAGCPFPLRILGWVQGDHWEEWRMHQAFKPLQVDGTEEWFHLTPELWGRIRDLCSGCT